MATWHNFSECSRLDLFESQGLSTCLNWGSSYVEPQPSEENPAWKQHLIESNEDGKLDSTADDEYGSQVESSDEEAGASKRHRRVKWKAAGAREFDIYQPIKQRSQMRLFLIRTGEVGDQLRGELVTVDIGSQDYDAIL